MRLASVAYLLLPASLLLTAGCANNPYALQGKVQTLEQNQNSLASRAEQLKTHADSLDRNNAELESLLAQERQQKRLLEDQVSAMRDQLNTTTTQLAKAKTDVDQYTKKTDALEASVKKQAGATIRANSSLKNTLPPIKIQGVEVRQDGDVVRVELPGTRLFENGTARLTPEGSRLIDDVIVQVLRAYPEQIIGVEGHTSSDPVPAGRWTSQHQLSTGMAMAVYEQLTQRTQTSPGQLFIVGHGANHPAASNATLAGRERNLRVEFVVYPEKPGSR